MNTEQTWRPCSTCKKSIPLRAVYYRCSVSTCRSKRMNLAFCSVSCWDAHLGYANHREAYAEEETAPAAPAESVHDPSGAAAETQKEDKKESPVSEESKGKSLVFRKPTAADQVETETLVVVSKVKKLIRDQSEMNTSQCCIEELTRKVVEECLKGIERARVDGRRTVKGRDII